MGMIRSSACGKPGPYTAHCTSDIAHEFSCYDAGEDVSFNDRQDFVHGCTDPNCPTPHFENEGD